jgi:HTH-type transcriptional regulator / antitoxin MqsA
MRFEKRPDEIQYEGRKRTLRTLGWWCSKCNEAIFDGAVLKAREKAFLQLKAEVDGVLGPKEVAKVRESLKLSQRKAGEILGGGPRAFQKYESGQQAVSVPMSNLLRLLAREPRRLRELSRASGSATEARRSTVAHGAQQTVPVVAPL